MPESTVTTIPLNMLDAQKHQTISREETLEKFVSSMQKNTISEKTKMKSKWLIWNHQLIINATVVPGTVIGIRSGNDKEGEAVQVIIETDHKYGEAYDINYYTLAKKHRLYLVDYDPDYSSIKTDRI